VYTQKIYSERMIEMSCESIKIDTKILDGYKNVHPRIMTDPKRMEDLKYLIGHDKKYIVFFERLKEYVDEVIKTDPPEYVWTEGEHEGWQVKATRQMPSISMCYVFTREQKYLDAAVKWARTSCSYPTWGKEVVLNSDLCAATQMLGLSIVYDWCYEDLDTETRDLIKTTLRQRGEDMYKSACFETKVFWKNYWLQNHLWIDVCALAAISVILYDDYPETIKWLERAVYLLERITEVMGDDGASHEGYMYWEYGLEWLFKFLEIARKFAGVDKFNTTWFRETVNYGIYMLLPMDTWRKDQNCSDMADGDRMFANCFNTMGLEHIMRKLAAEYGNYHAQWLADVVEEKKLSVKISEWLNLLWYDGRVEPKRLENLSTLKLFDDMGIISARTDWSGNESFLTVRCGPYIGHKAYHMNNTDPFEDWGGGHVHPDVNHISLFGCGEWLLRDDGYSNKKTENHSTLLIDGKGQAGEGREWLDSEKAHHEGGCPKVLMAEGKGEVIHLSCDGTEAYPKSQKLKKFIRNLLCFKSGTLFVIDEVETNESCELELRFIPESENYIKDGDDYIFIGEKSKLRFSQLSPEAGCEVEQVRMFMGRDNALTGKIEQTQGRTIISVKNSGPVKWLNISSFTWCDKDKEPLTASVEVSDGIYCFKAGEQSYTLSFEK
jgi:hypothetical protein